MEDVISVTLTLESGDYLNEVWVACIRHMEQRSGKITELGRCEVHINNSRTDRGARIEDLVIYEEHRRKGYCTRLLDVLASWNCIKGIVQFLDVYVDNLGAIEVYKKAGFTLTPKDGKMLLAQRVNPEPSHSVELTYSNQIAFRFNVYAKRLNLSMEV